ncbi:MAG: hypothetical protein LBC74_00040 [Planctomycetaceae bacterium]|nr:hypothetical protein [Planctomycetaceae bacterium]
MVSEELKAVFVVVFLLCWCIFWLEKRNTRPFRYLVGKQPLTPPRPPLSSPKGGIFA